MAKKELLNLVQVKKDLVAKYERMAATRKSKPRRVSLLRRAEFYRQQVLNLERTI